MFVVNPDPFLLPCYRICPFTTNHIGINAELPSNNFAENYLNDRFGKDTWQYTYNGREAIQLALEVYQLAPTDLVTILTTSNNYYISSCVTKEIEKVCCWNREILPETKLIFVNHEFGYPFPKMDRLVATGLPIIEDCCTTFFSQDTNGNIGRYGDFSVYSFPKFFPIQIGGILVNQTKRNKAKSLLKIEEKLYIENTISYYLADESALLQKRKAIFDYACEKFTKLGFTLRFAKSDKVVPSVLLLNNNGVIKDLNVYKYFLINNGVQNSIFYGEDAFFIPVHQNISTIDIDFFYICTEYFIKQML